MNKSGSFWKSPKFLALFGVLLLLIIMPIILFAARQRQVTNQNAATLPIHGANFTIIPSETTSCPDDGQQHSVSSYGGYFQVTNVSFSQSFQVIVHRFFCPTGAVGDCEMNDKAIDFGRQSFANGQTINFPAPPAQALSPNDFYTDGRYSGQACGTYQSDIEFVNFSNGIKFQSALWCHTNIDCSTVTPTPTFTPTPTPTPIPSSTPTLTPTPIPSSTPTPTPPLCPIPSPVTNVQITCPNCPKQ